MKAVDQNDKTDELKVVKVPQAADLGRVRTGQDGKLSAF